MLDIDSKVQYCSIKGTMMVDDVIMCNGFINVVNACHLTDVFYLVWGGIKRMNDITFPVCNFPPNDCL